MDSLDGLSVYRWNNSFNGIIMFRPVTVYSLAREEIERKERMEDRLFHY